MRLAGRLNCLLPVAICVVTYNLLPLEKDKWKVGQFFFSVLPLSSPAKIQNKKHPFGGVNRGCSFPTPTYLTFCRFQIEFNSFTPNVFVSSLVLDSLRRYHLLLI